MHHAVDVAGQSDEQSELGDVLDFALNLGPGRVIGEKFLPRVAHALLEAERDTPLLGIRVEHFDLDLLARRDDHAGLNILARPAHLGDMDQSLDARLQLDEGAVIGDVGDAARIIATDRILERHAVPGIGLKLLHAQRNALGLGIEANDLHFHGLTDLQGLGGMVDALPRDIGDVQESIDAAQINKGAIIRDVLDHAFQDLSFLEVGDQFGSGLGARLFQDGAPGNHDVAPRPVHLENLEGLGRTHEGRDVTHRADVEPGCRAKRPWRPRHRR